MAYRYLIYRTDFGNTIVRESPTNTATGGTEQSFYSDFVIPEIQPLYLWRYPGSGTDAVPNTDDNINDWLNHIASPLQPEDDATVGYVTGLTSQKIDKVTGATGHVGTFTSDGNLEDSGYNISQLTGGTTGDYVTNDTFTGYTATTETRITGIEDDVNYLSGVTDTKLNISDFNTYSANTDTRITNVENDINDLSGLTANKIDKVTGATGNLGAFTSDGNLEDTGYAVSDLTGGTGGGGIFAAEYTLTNLISDAKPGAGYVRMNSTTPSAVTWIYIDNLQYQSKDVGNFYASLTEGDEFLLRQTIDSTNSYLFDVTGNSIQTAQGSTGYVKIPVKPKVLNGTVPYNKVFAAMEYNSGVAGDYVTNDKFTGYTATTETRISGIEDDVDYISGVTDTKLDTDIFTGYTASTAPNEIYLIHTGGTNLNTTTATAIIWDKMEVSGSSFSWTGGSDIYILDSGKYEINYNIPYNAAGSRNMAVGSNVILNNSTVINSTAAAGFTTDTDAAANLALPTVIVELSSGDKLTLAAFRTGRSGTANSAQDGSILIKKKNTLQ